MALESRLSDELIRVRPLLAAQSLESLTPSEAAAVLGSVAPTNAAAVVGAMSPPAAEGVIEALKPHEAASVLEALAQDLASRLARRLRPQRRELILQHVNDETRGALDLLLNFPEGTAGALMDPMVMALSSDVSVAETMRRIQEEPNRARYNLYVVDRDQVLIGVVNLRELLLRSGDGVLSDIMVRDPLYLTAHADRSTIVAHPGWKQVHSVPVVDDKHRYLGAIRYRTLRRLERELFGRAQVDADASEALGELFSEAAAGLIEAFGGSGRRGLHD